MSDSPGEPGASATAANAVLMRHAIVLCVAAVVAGRVGFVHADDSYGIEQPVIWLLAALAAASAVAMRRIVAAAVGGAVVGGVGAAGIVARLVVYSEDWLVTQGAIVALSLIACVAAACVAFWSAQRCDGASPGRCRRCGGRLADDAGEDCPSCSAPADEAVKPVRASPLWVVSVGVLVAIVQFGPAFMCTCGFFDRAAFILTVPLFVLAWWPFLLAREGRFLPRVVAIVAVVAATMLLFKNICDVLWLGHNPVF
ncbi:MAG: hypothetical protein PVJ57_01880 [Phycisphaerae bacterium]|jgi:hypothetical protein